MSVCAASKANDDEPEREAPSTDGAAPQHAMPGAGGGIPGCAADRSGGGGSRKEAPKTSVRVPVQAELRVNKKTSKRTVSSTERLGPSCPVPYRETASVFAMLRAGSKGPRFAKDSAGGKTSSLAGPRNNKNDAELVVDGTNRTGPAQAAP